MCMTVLAKTNHLGTVFLKNKFVQGFSSKQNCIYASYQYDWLKRSVIAINLRRTYFDSHPPYIYKICELNVISPKLNECSIIAFK